MNDTFAKAAEAGEATRFDDHYMRMTMTFDTGAKNYAWLKENLFIVEGRLSPRISQPRYHNIFRQR